MKRRLISRVRSFFVPDVRTSSAIGPYIVRTTAAVCAAIAVIATFEASLTDQRYVSTIIIGIACVLLIMPPLSYLNAHVHMRNYKLRERLRASIRRARRQSREMEARNAELEEVRRLLSDAANSDPLTGLANRRHFDIVLQERFDSGEPFGVIALDLDAFKPVNDIFGHEAGDTVLQNVARRLTELMEPLDGLIARTGGDEFVILVNSIEEKFLAELSVLMKAALAKPHIYNGDPLHVGASVGYRVADLDFDEASEVVAAADRALLADKERMTEMAVAHADKEGVVRGSFGRSGTRRSSAR